MFNVCFQCGACRVDKIIEPDGPFAICPECGYRHAFRRLPLLMVSGASGVGKSTVCRALSGKVSEAILLDSDLLWRREFDTPENKYREYFETWLRLCKNIAQSGRPVVLFGACIGVPENIEPCLERRYFSDLYYLALTCDPHTQTERLQQRPAWRKSADQEHLETHIRFNQWFQENADKLNPTIDLFDTTHASLEETCVRVASWIRVRLAHTEPSSA